MIITVYNYTDDSPRLDKTAYLSQLGTYTGTVRDSVDIVNPEIIVDGNIIDGNYAKIDTFDGYYHIIEKTAIRNNLTRIIFKRDAAMTFLNGIKNSSCICARCGAPKTYNSDFGDSRYKTIQKRYIETFASFEALDNGDALIFAFVE